MGIRLLKPGYIVGMWVFSMVLGVAVGALPAQSVRAGDNGGDAVSTVEVKVDRRVQAVTTIYWLVTKGKAFDGYVDKSYGDRTKYYFHRYHNHVAFDYARKLNDAGFTGEQAVRWILTHSTLPELEPTEESKKAAKQPVTEDDLSAFADSLRDFTVDTNFDAFLNQQSLPLFGQATRTKEALDGAGVADGVQVLVTPLIGGQSYDVVTETGHYLVVNPYGYKTVAELRSALGRKR